MATTSAITSEGGAGANPNTKRLAYIKNGDVVEQIRRVAQSAPGKIASSGPDAFIASLYSSFPRSELLLWSRHRRNAEEKSAAFNAFTRNSYGGFAGGALRRLTSGVHLLSKLLQYRPQLLLVGTTGSQLWICYLVSLTRGVPMVQSLHNRLDNDPSKLYRRISARIDIAVMKRIAGVACHGPYLRQQLLSAKIPADRVLEFDISFDELRDTVGCLTEKTTASQTTRKTILFVGRVEEQKGVLDLVRAIAPILGRNQDVSLVFAGDGAGISELENLVTELSLEDRVQLLGTVAHQNLVPLLVSSHALVTPTQPTFPEGRCMAAMESLVAGTPVIAPDFGPFPYLVEHNVNGILFEAGSVNALEAALTAVIEQPAHYDKLSEGARQSGAVLTKSSSSFADAVARLFDHNADG